MRILVLNLTLEQIGHLSVAFRSILAKKSNFIVNFTKNVVLKKNRNIVFRCLFFVSSALHFEKHVFGASFRKTISKSELQKYLEGWSEKKSFFQHYILSYKHVVNVFVDPNAAEPTANVPNLLQGNVSHFPSSLIKTGIQSQNRCLGRFYPTKRLQSIFLWILMVIHWLASKLTHFWMDFLPKPTNPRIVLNRLGRGFWDR